MDNTITVTAELLDHLAEIGFLNKIKPQKVDLLKAASFLLKMAVQEFPEDE